MLLAPDDEPNLCVPRPFFDAPPISHPISFLYSYISLQLSRVLYQCRREVIDVSIVRSLVIVRQLIICSFYRPCEISRIDDESTDHFE